MCKPLRLLVVLPSWVGDAVMATPALALLRSELPGAYIGGLLRPGIDDLLAGSGLLDEVHTATTGGMMGPKRLAAKVRGRGYDTALLFTNSFSTALAVRMALIERRIGYDRDGRGMLLSQRLAPARRTGGPMIGRAGFACVPACVAYLRLAHAAIHGSAAAERADEAALLRGARLRLAVTTAQHDDARRVLARAGVEHLKGSWGGAVLNPGANNPAKRWPAERFAQIGARLVLERGLRVLVSGGPGEADLCAAVTNGIHGRIGPSRWGMAGDLCAAKITLGGLKGVLKGAALLMTNDTGPRHIAAAFATPTVTLFGPTDPRWTTLPADSPGAAGRIDLCADPTLPADQLADDHPERCRIERIEPERAWGAVERALAENRAGEPLPSPVEQSI